MRAVGLADIPGRQIDAGAVTTAAGAITDAAERLRTAGTGAVGTWADLASAYDAPEAPTLAAAMDPVSRDATTSADAAVVAASALSRYAEDVADVQARMRVTSSLVTVLSQQIAGAPGWRTDPALSSRNDTLLRQVRSAEDDLDQAARVCASRIRGALGVGTGRPATPYLTAPGPMSWAESQRHLVTGDDPRTNPLFFLNASPAEVRQWWGSLTPADRERIVTEHPQLVGNRDGIPAAVRDRANRIQLAAARSRLETEIDELEKRMGGDPRYSPHNPSYSGPDDLVGPLLWDETGRRYLERARARLEVVTALEAVLAKTTVGPRQLLVLRLDRPYPRAAIAIGDVDTASHIGILVPGTGTTIEHIEPRDEDAKHLFSASQNARSQLSSRTATINWQDYDAPPDLHDALFPGRAVTGGEDLSRFVDGISSATAGSSPPRITIFGHSYGALVANEAAAGSPQTAPTVVVAGAPGVGYESADSSARFAMLASDDPIRAVHIFLGKTSLGIVPYDGMVNRDAGPWVDLDTREIEASGDLSSTGSSGHSEYLKDGSTSQENLAHLIVDEPPPGLRDIDARIQRKGDR